MNPTIINNLDVANNQTELNGEIAVGDCDRLANVLFNANDHGQPIRYQMQGLKGKYHLPSLNLMIEASLVTTCQRCLDPLPIEMKLSFDYVLSESEPESFNGDEEVDWLEVSREMNVNNLIEDELLMAIPLAPTHDYKCKSSQFESGEKHNPFSALKDLIR
jgi:uncharacterized protein